MVYRRQRHFHVHSLYLLREYPRRADYHAAKSAYPKRPCHHGDLEGKGKGKNQQYHTAIGSAPLGFEDPYIILLTIGKITYLGEHRDILSLRGKAKIDAYEKFVNSASRSPRLCLHFTRNHSRYDQLFFIVLMNKKGDGIPRSKTHFSLCKTVPGFHLH